jgi:hypothetical protein
MPEWIRDLGERRRHRAEIDTINAKFVDRYDAAEDDEEQHFVNQEWEVTLDPHETALGLLDTKKLLRQAQRWGIDIPDDYWTFGRIEDERYIGYSGRTKLRREISKARREAIRWWIQTVVMPLIALVSVATAWMSLFFRAK